MSIPSWNELGRPALAAIVNNSSLTSKKDIVKFLANQFNITDDELKMPTSHKSHEPMFKNRVGWALSNLKRRGLLDSPIDGIYYINDFGSRAYEEHKNDNKDLFQLYPLLNSDVIGQTPGGDELAAILEPIMEDHTPDEVTEVTVEKSNEPVREELKMRIKELDYNRFNTLMGTLLSRKGLGTPQYIDGPGDRGIDIIMRADMSNQDEIERISKHGEDIACQNKAWSQHKVGSPQVNAFAGALARVGYRRGIIATASTFTDDALAAIKEIQVFEITPLDIEKIIDIMIACQVGVKVVQIFKKYEVDTNYFTRDKENAENTISAGTPARTPDYQPMEETEVSNVSTELQEPQSSSQQGDSGRDNMVQPRDDIRSEPVSPVHELSNDGNQSGVSAATEQPAPVLLERKINRESS